MSRLRPHKRNDHGAAAVEFALILPILLILVFGIIDFTRALNASVSATHAAREGVRVLALGDEDSESAAHDRAQGAFDVSLASGGLQFDETETCDDGTDDAVLEVSASVDWITPLGGFVDGIGDGISVRGVAEMRCGG